MSKTDSKFLAMLEQKCPRCHQGPLFCTSAFNITKFADMPADCPVCGQRYEPEPGFYWGAMYITFAFSTGIMLVVGFLVYHLLNDPDTWVYVSAVAFFAVVLAPLSLRYSRTLMLYWFGGVHYEPERANRSGQRTSTSS